MLNLKTEGLDEFNPFEDPSSQVTTPASQPAVLKVSDSEAPPAYVSISKSTLLPDATLPTPQQSIMTVADLERRQAELDSRAAQLDLRERQQQQQQEAWRSAHGYGEVGPPNWPPLPKWFCLRPCIRIDFTSDIPSHCRWLAKYTHYFWLAYSLLLIFNIFGALAFFVVSQSPEAGPSFGVSIVVAILTPPAAFFCWNRPLYKALKNDSSFNFCLFFPLFGCQLVIIFIQVLGINYLGACGWINSLKTLQTNTPVATFMILIALLFSLAAASAIYLILTVHNYYRGSGASSKKARQELTSRIIGQETVPNGGI